MISERQDMKPIAWRVRPYEADAWIVVTDPPTEETRRYMEFVPIYAPMADDQSAMASDPSLRDSPVDAR